MRDWNKELHPSVTPGAQVIEAQAGVCRLQIPAGGSGRYRLAQLDDYNHLSRQNFSWHVPLRMTLQARASAEEIPGTWGFGFWNDPFGMELVGEERRKCMPVLPNAVWFFFASKPNYLTLDDKLPPSGRLAATFRTTIRSAAVLIPGMFALPLLLIPFTARVVRRMSREVIGQDTAEIQTNPTEWNKYELCCTQESVKFSVGDELMLETSVIPNGRLGFVLWVDNRYAAFPSDGRFRYGTLRNPDPAWIEVKNLLIE